MSTFHVYPMWDTERSNIRYGCGLRLCERQL